MTYVDKIIVQHHRGAWHEVQPLDLEDLRIIMMPRVPLNRPELVSKLAEFGARSLRELDPKHYRAFKKYLLTLKPL